jgi:hypothetical protein
MDLLKVGEGRGDWIDLALDRNIWRTLCGYGEGLSDSINAGNFLTGCKIYWLASQEGLCSLEEVSIYSLIYYTVYGRTLCLRS